MPKVTTKGSSISADITAFFNRLRNQFETGDLTLLGIQEDSVELFQEAGVTTIRELAEADPADFSLRLQKIVNEKSEQFRRAPSYATVNEWMQAARDLEPENAWHLMLREYRNQAAHRQRERASRNAITLSTHHNHDQYLAIGYIEQELLPFIKALTEIQRVIDEVTHSPHNVRIFGITRNSPISISIDGVSDALALVREMVTPWRRLHAEKMAQLVEQEAELKAEKLKAEILEGRARAARDRAEIEKISAEAAKQREEVERLRLENERMRLAIEAKKLELATNLIATLQSQLPDDVKQVMTNRLADPLYTILNSDLELLNS